MRMSDLSDFEHGPTALLKLALLPLMIVAVFSAALGVLSHLSPGAVFGLLCLLVSLSPVAYLIRERRVGRHTRDRSRRGAERTPVLPRGEGEEP